jgi:two-component system, chemotaxis family, CheB/CheR fusion protein
MAKRQSSDRRPSKDEKKKINLKKDPIARKGSKNSKPPGSSVALTTRPMVKNKPALESRADNKIFPIVGIGASAGGLEAFTKLLENLPPDTGMAFVLVQHLAPTKDSILAELLSKATTMTVSEVQDGMTVEPDHVYVIPPNTIMAIFHGALTLQPRAEPHSHHMPVDAFFRSLAQDQGQNAFGIILSGTGSDGSLGIQALKAEGGIILAQDERSAKYDGMPKSAIATGTVDYILPPEKLAAEIVRISHHPVMTFPTALKTDHQLKAGVDDLNKIFMRIRTGTGVDFTYYKQATILRRIHRRMLLNKIEAMEQYVRYLQENPAEVEVLYQDILINVTSFFRDPETFNALTNVVFPRILEKKSSDSPLRIWVPGCSTGEETYSLAMCFSEFSEELSISPPILFFASDIDETSIEKARQGLYPENIAEDVSSERLRRFFNKTEQGYQISKTIRDQCVFARQNLIKDPPFSKMDLISCRNLMIYFGPVLQRKALPILHYALNPSGYLMLGRSESIGEFADLFSLVDKKNRIYSKKTASTQLRFDQDQTRFEVKSGLKKKAEVLATEGPDDIQKATDSIILGRYSPAGLVINENMDILHFRGNISPYLKPRSGKASLNLMKMASESLAMDLRVLIHQAREKNIAIRKEGIKIRHNKVVTIVNIEVIAFKTRAISERMFLVIFEDTSGLEVTRVLKNRGKAAAKLHGLSHEAQIAALEGELAATQQHLRSVLAEYETSTEEQKALNEEVQSSNEELQSINEELETSKEELQSTNEELSTVNDELRDRNNDISQINNDLINVLSGVEIPILLIGNKLQIRRFNRVAAKKLNLIASDIGRQISDIRPNINAPDLDKMILGVIDSQVIRQQELQDREGSWYSMTIRPYKTIDNRIDGALMTLEDINDLKLGITLTQEARDYSEAIVETVREPLIVLSKDLRVVTANQAYYKNFNTTPDEVMNKYFYKLQNGLWDIPRLREMLESVLVNNSVFNDFEVAYEASSVDPRVLLINARTVISKDPDTHLVLFAIEDITGRRLAEEALRKSEKRYRSLFENMLNGFAYCKMLYEDGLAQDFIYLEVNSSFGKLTGLKNVVGKKVSEVIPGIRESYPVLLEIYGRVALTGKPESFEIYLEPLAAWLFVSVYSTEKGYFVAVFDNITERKRTEGHTQARLRMLSIAASPPMSRDETLQIMLDEIEKQTGSTIGFYHFLEADQETLSLQAWSTNTLRNMCTAEVKGSHYNISQAGVWVDCVRERRLVIHNDYASLAHRKGTPEGHAEIKREMVVPILRGGRIVAIIGVGNKPVDYNATDIEVAESLGQLSWEIFERIRVAEELQTAHAEVERRTQELMATNKELEAFSYSASHDLRAPLRSVSEFSKIIYEDYADKLDAQGRDYLNRIKNGTDRMNQLIEDLLRLSRISLQNLDLMDYDLSRLASAVVNSIHEISPARNFEVVIAEGLHAVVDPNLMEIVFTNLINNACKFTSKIENARIEFGATKKDEKTIYFIKDNGAGFDPTSAERMFLPFQRLHSEQEFEGTGIGLTIVERIIRRHEGRIWAEGEVGKGATIYFTLGQRERFK